MRRVLFRLHPALSALLLIATAAGCRVCLPPVDESNLWLRAVEDRTDRVLGQPPVPPHSTHRWTAMDAREIGFRRGYTEMTFATNGLPPGDYRALWSPIFRNRFCDENLVNGGYVSGREAALVEAPIGIARR